MWQWQRQWPSTAPRARPETADRQGGERASRALPAAAPPAPSSASASTRRRAGRSGGGAEAAEGTTRPGLRFERAAGRTAAVQLPGDFVAAIAGALAEAIVEDLRAEGGAAEASAGGRNHSDLVPGRRPRDRRRAQVIEFDSRGVHGR